MRAKRKDLLRVVMEALAGAIDQQGEVIADVVFARWHTGYIAKSQGGVDEFGNEWEELQPSTIAAKQRRRTGGFRDRDRRAEWLLRKNNLQAQLIASGMSRADAAAKASDLAWNDFPTGGGGVPINVDTTRLEQSLSPEGSQDQVREFSRNEIRLGTTVEYAKHVNKKRRIKPSKAEAREWVRVAQDILRARVAREIERRTR